MRLGPTYRKTGRWILLVMFGLTSIVGAGVLGCDNVEVQTVVLGGIQDLAVTLIDAFFITLQPEEEVTPVTVSGIMDTAHAKFC